jgi:UPF0755 protein
MYIRKILVAIAIISVLGLTYLSYTIYEAVFSPNTAFQASEQPFYISKKDNFDSIIKKLDPLLKDTSSFLQVAQRKKYEPRSGHFILKKGMNNNDLVNMLRSQNIPVDITFNNAESLKELSENLSNQLDLTSEEILEAFAENSTINDLKLNKQQQLSLFIPNTYEVYWNLKAEDLTERLLKEYNKFWNAEREAKRQKLNLSRIEVATLASIVQKETAKVDERPKVAGVYINRLKRSMKLEADPSVVFAIKQKYNKPDTIIRRVLFKDLEIDSPYNTYKNYGLPPAPLIMPDVSSIDAVLNYQKHNYLFFVADMENPGYHVFAKTLSQHNKNANAYRKWINKQGIYR